MSLFTSYQKHTAMYNWSVDGRIFGNANLVMTILIMTNLVRKNLVMTNMVKICYKSGNDKVGIANLVK